MVDGQGYQRPRVLWIPVTLLRGQRCGFAEQRVRKEYYDTISLARRPRRRYAALHCREA
jgi:hypothetical protein